jgi:glutathione peroxidase
MNSKNFHDFVVQDGHGKDVRLSSFAGKKVFVVNTASACGYTPQYAQMQELHEAYSSKGLVVMAFPCNDFGGQEPGSIEEIEAFCSTRFGVTFPVMDKVKIKGKLAHPLFKWLQEQAENGVADMPITWNFFKFLIDEKGQWVNGFRSAVEPASDQILEWIVQPQKS